MIIPLEDLQKYDFALSNIRILCQRPTYHKQRHYKRILNGFVYLIAGKCRFSFAQGSITLHPGAICYLPYGSNHTLEILEEGTTFYRMDFCVTIDGEVALFSDGPLLLSPVASPECAEAIQRMADRCELMSNTVIKMECLCRVFRHLIPATETGKRRRVAAAAEYLQSHFTERFSCENLARFCNLGMAQFYNIFRDEYGMTPLAYRDELLLQRAKLLLQDGTLSVGEVADMLGFESPAYFSRFFKKHVGLPPSRFSEERKEHDDDMETV